MANAVYFKGRYKPSIMHLQPNSHSALHVPTMVTPPLLHAQVPVGLPIAQAHTPKVEGSVQEIYLHGTWIGPIEMGNARREERQGRYRCVSCRDKEVESRHPVLPLKHDYSHIIWNTVENRKPFLETPAASLRDFNTNLLDNSLFLQLNLLLSCYKCYPQLWK